MKLKNVRVAICVILAICVLILTYLRPTFLADKETTDSKPDVLFTATAAPEASSVPVLTAAVPESTSVPVVTPTPVDNKKPDKTEKHHSTKKSLKKKKKAKTHKLAETKNSDKTKKPSKTKKRVKKNKPAKTVVSKKPSDTVAENPGTIIQSTSAPNEIISTTVPVKPVETGEVVTKQSEKKTETCIISIDCSEILRHPNKLAENKKDIIPEKGVILASYTCGISEGDTVFDVLKKAAKENKIHIEYTITPLYNSAYIEGIANIYEFDCGVMSGWTYTVNNDYPAVGCSDYKIKKGDVIKFIYTTGDGL